jgi:hypothetical protein
VHAPLPPHCDVLVGDASGTHARSAGASPAASSPLHCL